MKLKHYYNLSYYEPKLWEKVILFVLPLKEVQDGDTIVFYKIFLNRIYIVATVALYHEYYKPTKWDNNASNPEKN